MPLVLSAPARAASAAFFTSPVCPSTSTKGYSASTRVRSPGRAGVYRDMASLLCFRAAAQTPGSAAPGARLRRAPVRALRKMAYSAPEVPSMVFSTTGTAEARSTTASPVKGFCEMCLRMAGKPLCQHAAAGTLAVADDGVVLCDLGLGRNDPLEGGRDALGGGSSVVLEVAGLGRLAGIRLLLPRGLVLGLPSLLEDRRRPTGGLCGEVQQLDHAGTSDVCVDNVEQRDAEPEAVEAGHVRPAQNSDGADAVAVLQLRGDLGRDAAQLQRAHAAEVIDQEHDLVRVDIQKRAIFIALVQQLREHLAHQARQVSLLPTGAGLVVNAHAELGLAEAQGAFVLAARDGAPGDVHMLQTRADADEVLGGQAGDLCDVGQRPALGGQCAGDLVDEDGAGDAAAADLACLGAADTDVVTDDDHLDGEAGGAGLLNSHAEVEHIAGVVHDGDEDTLGGVDARGDGGSHLLGARAGEDGAGDGSGEEALADHGGEGRLVA
ncbi:hypothetical protein ColKHC_02374 [Colletotrichum higginsianum]|nr:hypothetical protein ColKHC_02374 [Colletotrichum higginsianum]